LNSRILEFQDFRPRWQTAHECRLNGAGQSKSSFLPRLPVQDEVARPSYPSGPAARPVASKGGRLFAETIPQGDNDMGTQFARRLLLGAAIASSLGIGYAIGAQPHMGETIALLQSARAELVKATPNKGGHRERALGLIDQAIGEVQAGMNFAGGN
jgi:hypothetical protein